MGRRIGPRWPSGPRPLSGPGDGDPAPGDLVWGYADRECPGGPRLRAALAEEGFSGPGLRSDLPGRPICPLNGLTSVCLVTMRVAPPSAPNPLGRTQQMYARFRETSQKLLCHSSL